MKTLITGGAGFIGSNTVDHLLSQGDEVVVVDNLSRPGSEKNLAWLRDRHGDFPFVQQDIRDYDGLEQAFKMHLPFEALFHFAAQVAVTTSVENPHMDFETNARGTLNVLEAVRQLGLDPVLLYTSTNKVYGALSSIPIVEEERRYRYVDLEKGVSEEMPLDFYSPYGCSKGAADQYIHDYFRIYGMRTVVFRNSCIYGPRQFGIEDQGWLAWLVIAAVSGRPITIYGNGKQVRDVLFIDDLVEAMTRAVENAEVAQGEVYNIGGGMQSSLSVWREFGPLLSDLLGQAVEVSFGDWRPGDQKVYVSDISKAQRDFGWEPRVGVQEGVERLLHWVRENSELFE
jgi:CDP-paratose 2-epimerase